MSMFEDRERAFEAKFAQDQELAFRISARRNKLVGLWAAQLMGLTAEETESYARSVIQADFEESGDEAVIRKLLGDLLMAGVDVNEAQVRSALSEKSAEARRQFMK